jgi:XTP/dITP diphosphohydrolase
VLATKNPGKVREIAAMLQGIDVDVRSLSDYAPMLEIDEDGGTFLANALKKARIVAEQTGEAVLADDSGLEVEALGGAPGVHSARYAGEGATDESNIRKLLEEMRNVPPGERAAAFHCVLVFFRPDGSHATFNGTLKGVIADVPAGDGGFGYDPVFYLPGEGVTVAQLSPAVKNGISHRAEAMEKFKRYLLSEIIHRRNGA